ncbi:hypothetical protein A2111_00700 [Candidatus Daviesbacteria bacterium GWA1_38_6]|nr:MAG: hypothetical protein A2111_00700 [Candidatus Daviesbacteria bacterium GWA1_38_6]
MDKIVRISIADLLINLSAGWFGLAFVAPFLAERTLLVKIAVLTTDVGFGILFLIAAIWLRRRLRK